MADEPGPRSTPEQEGTPPAPPVDAPPYGAPPAYGRPGFAPPPPGQPPYGPPPYGQQPPYGPPPYGQQPPYGQPPYGRPGFPPQAGVPGGVRASAAWLWLALLGLVGGLIGFFQLRERDRSRARQVLGLGAAVTAGSVVLTVVLYATVLGAAAHLASAANAGPPSTDPFVPQATGTSAAPTPSAGPVTRSDGLKGGYLDTYRAAYAATYSNAQGYTQVVRVGFGSVVPYTSTTPLAGDVTTCSVRPQTDALIPFVIETENTTAQFPQRVHADLDGAGAVSDSSTGVSAVVFFGSGPSCKDWTTNGSISEHSTNALPAGQFSATKGYLILSGYYSPAHPNGDPSLVTQMAAAVGNIRYSDDDGSSGSLTLTGCTGPGAQLSGGYLAKCTMPFGHIV